MTYGTEVFGLSAAAIGTILLIGRGFDAFSDLFMGMIADRSKFQMGRYRFWIYLGAPILGLLTFVMFATPEIDASFKFTFAVIIYVLHSAFATMCSVPYHALTAVIADDADGRTQLVAFKQFIAMIATLIVGVVVPQIIANSSTPEAGYRTQGQLSVY